ncbi:pyrroline-5-carboxylate reductase [Nocardia stercoris]|uniref:Pyrroline-5-carboxylate reductase n=1 Tax=Nocardia stercoris TaxID=2483361 RepID=A0A3M2KZI9_9NOCA|nr:pyrroline-5-carboxylate reductase [Nocardia stercoris]RMI30852.1 pyrroline-5-carboxylate reductase [Nocardia stercoris]
MTKIAVVGGGQIGEALLAGLLESGHVATDLSVVEPSPARAEQLSERLGVQVRATATEAAQWADIVVIAVKPQVVPVVLGEIGKVELDRPETDQLVVSLAAGVTIASIESLLPVGTPVVRVMPNTPMLVGEGMSALAPGRCATAAQLAQVGEIMSAVGAVVTVTEAQLDAVTAVSGSGPAYFFLVVEAMIDGGVGLGLGRDVATQLVAQTMLGSAALLAKSGKTPVELRAGVTSPGGTTAAALRELERAGVRSAFQEALHAAEGRARELGATPS